MEPIVEGDDVAATSWRHTLPLLLLVLHFWGEAWQAADSWQTAAEERAAALRVAIRAASRGASMASAPPEELVVHVLADVLRTEVASLVFIAALLEQQDVESAARQAKLHAEWGIGDEEESEEPPSHTLLSVAMAACAEASELYLTKQHPCSASSSALSEGRAGRVRWASGVPGASPCGGRAG